MKEVDVPNVGTFEFPDEITDAEIDNEINGYLKANGIKVATSDNAPGLGSSFQRGLVGSQQGLTTDLAASGIIDPEDGAAEIARLEREKRKYPTPQALEEFSNAGNDARKLARAFIKAPLTIIGNTVAEGIGSSVPAMAAGGAGALATAWTGPGALVGGMVGTGVGSLALEAGGKILETLAEEGVDLEDEDSLIAAFNNPELMARASKKGVMKGIPIAVVDAFSVGIAGRFTAAARVAGKGITKAAAKDLALQTGLAGAGEAAGEYAADQKLSAPDILLEMIGEVGPGAVETVAGAAIRGLKKEPDVDSDVPPDTSQKLLTYEKKGQLLLEDLRPDIDLDLPALPPPNRVFSPEEQSQEQIIRGAGGKFTKTSTGFVAGEQLPLSEEAAFFKREQETKARQLRQQQLREQATVELGEKGLDIVSGRLEAIDVNDVPGNLVQRLRARDIRLGISDKPRSVYFREDLQGIGIFDEDVDAILGTTPEVTPNEIPVTANVTRGQFTMALRNILSSGKTTLESIKKAADFRGENADIAARELLGEMARTGLAKVSKDGKRFTIGKEERKAIELAVAAETPNGGIEAGTMQREGFTGTAEQVSKQNGLFKRDGTPFQSAAQFDVELEALRAERQQLQDQIINTPLDKRQRAAGAERLRYFNRYIAKLEAAAMAPAIQRLRTQELDQPRTKVERMPAPSRPTETNPNKLSPDMLADAEWDKSGVIGIVRVFDNRYLDRQYYIVDREGNVYGDPIIDQTVRAHLEEWAPKAAVDRIIQRLTELWNGPSHPNLNQKTIIENTERVGQVNYFGVPKDFAKVLNEWLKLIGSTANIVLLDIHELKTSRIINNLGLFTEDNRLLRQTLAEHREAGGSMFRADKNSIFDLGENTYVITVNRTAARDYVNSLETMAHEFGHFIAFSELDKIKNTADKAAVLDDYNRWKSSKFRVGITMNDKDMARAILRPTFFSQVEASEHKEYKRYTEYFSSFGEWFAERSVNFILNKNEDMQAPVQKYFGLSLRKLKELWQSFVSMLRHNPEAKKLNPDLPGFDTFMEGLLQRARQDRQQVERMASDVPRELSRAEFKDLIDKGWTFKQATLQQMTPGSGTYNPKAIRAMVNYAEPSRPVDRKPVILTPPGAQSGRSSGSMGPENDLPDWVGNVLDDITVNDVELLQTNPDFGVVETYNLSGQPIFVAISADGYRTNSNLLNMDPSKGAGRAFSAEILTLLKELAVEMNQLRISEINAGILVQDGSVALSPQSSDAAQIGQVKYTPAMEQLAKLLNEWSRMIGNAMPIFLIDKATVATKEGRRKYGMEASYARGIIRSTLQPLTHGMMTGDQHSSVIMIDTTYPLAEQIETLAHEFGHHIMYKSFNQAPAEVQAAVKAEYEVWRQDALQEPNTGSDLINRLRGPFGSHAMHERAGGDLNATKAKEMNAYYSSFNEWFADNVSKWATTNALPMSAVDKFFSNVAKTIRKLWDMVRLHAQKNEFKVAPTVEAFLNEMVFTANTIDSIALYDNDIHESRTHADNSFRRQEALMATPSEGSIDRSAAAQYTSDGRTFGERMTEHTTRMNAPRSLDDVLTEAEPAQNWLNGNFTGDINSQRASDMGWASFWMRHPMQVATKSKIFEPVWRFIHARFRQQSRIIAEAEDGALTYRKMSTLERANVNKVLNLGDQTGIEFNIVNGLRPDGSLRVNAEITLSPKEVEGYIAIRKSVNFMWREMIKAFNAGLGLAPDTKPETLRNMAKDLAESGKGQQAARMSKAADTLANMLGAHRKGYMPHMRFGDHGVKVVDAAGNTVWYEARDLPTKRGREKALREWRAELQAKFPAAKGYRASAPFYLTQDSIRREVGDVGTDLERLISAFGNKDMEFWKEAHAEIDKMIAMQGFLAHQRQRRNVPGYSQDWGRVLDTYFKRGANFVAYQTQRKNVNEALQKIPESMPRLRKYAEDYVQYAMGPVEEFQSIRNATFNWFFGFNLSLGLINMTQIPFATVPYFTRFAGDARIAKEVALAYKDVAKMFSGKRFSLNRAFIDPTRAPADVRDDLVRDWNEAVLFPLQTADFTGMGTPGFQTTTGRGRKYVEQVTKTGAMVFQMAEETNRMVTYIAAHRLARDPKVAKRIREAMSANPRWTQNPQAKLTRKFAAFSVEETQFLMGKINRPKIMRGPGAVAFQFMSFPLQMLELIGRLATTYKAGGSVTSKVLNKQLAIMALFMFASAGVWGLPFADNLKELFQLIYKLFTKRGIDLDVELRKLMQDMGGDPITSDAFSRGIVRSLTGIDLSKRLGLGSIIPDGLFKGDVTDAVGAGPSTLINGLQRAMQRHASGQPLGMVLSEVSPVALKNVLQANIAQKRGVQTATGRQVLTPEEYTGSMGAAKVMGFTPTSQAREFEKDFSQQAMSVKVRDLQSYYLNLLAANRVEQIRAQKRGEDIDDLKSDRNKMLREIKSHNKAARANKEYESLITLKVEDIRAKVGEMLNPDRRIQKFPKKSRRAAQDIEDLYPE